ncbi:hypothetical protein DICPUDRAFT_28115 [Dictyostelium purpureum]|uniref:Purple acid phosphatase n=1 Tax=Dictyostelium purpureum TaxID=5786 RepID=F0ZBD3_DICPU|nr:uncharacterized protein DICPUDRAFT_28115 [Dictyostelium purpureum]EGC38726.1 hypothetical protein DICPUDRAFT_28115 [Dictyostelium purpureum]|eukprot:XP_003284717.1 hypothetical protein DICPUDRAFT_28115 [Dictyostelium purpureum]
MKNIVLIIILLNIFNIYVKGDATSHSVKLSFTKSIDQMKVTWYTIDKMVNPVVLFNTEMFAPEKDSVLSVQAQIFQYDTLGFKGYPTTATINGLSQKTTYYYCVGDKAANVYSQIYNFTTGYTANDNLHPFTAVFYGDMGYGGQGLNSDFYTVANVLKRSDEYDFIVHVGDIAYADLTHDSRISGNQTVWNLFLDSVNPLTSMKPYMTCPGNHDIFYDLSVYSRTWQMPADNEGDTWYSFDYNGVHFVGFSSEHDFFPLSPQYEWLEKDLRKYRQENPEGWLVVYSHRPFYCSAVWGWCEDSVKTDFLKKAFNLLENLLFKYNVDLYISGHQHAEEYTYPVYKSQNLGTFEEPKATVHITVGTGGDAEGEETQWQPKPSWSTGKRIFDTGVGYLTFYNTTTLGYKFIANVNNTVVDEFTMTKGHF